MKIHRKQEQKRHSSLKSSDAMFFRRKKYIQGKADLIVQNYQQIARNWEKLRKLSECNRNK